MGAGWVAGVTRAKAMAAGRAGPDTARRLAAAPGLPEAVRALAGTPYRRGLDTQAGPAEAQRAVSDALVWHLRVLAGWQPRPGAVAVRLLASGFEIENTRDLLRSLTEDRPPAPYRLGALSTAWPRLSRATGAADVRAVLATSVWGDPGADTRGALITGMRLSAAARTAAHVPPAARWAAGEAALLVAREVHLTGGRLTPQAARDAARLLSTAAVRAASFADYRARLAPAARWALEGVERPEDLWRAEARWWPTVDQDGQSLLTGARFGLPSVVGAVAVLSVDAWRVRAGLGCAAHDGRAREAFDELLG
ncbi:V-type ATPase subunit [Streptomyces sp. NPDC050803]|uniref:V-type ATPase subunit n=1 Tax=unclassified Streptomyces TaxID=2593676 RepID=UPI003445017F